jgi:hypothetical protein
MLILHYKNNEFIRGYSIVYHCGVHIYRGESKKQKGEQTWKKEGGDYSKKVGAWRMEGKHVIAGPVIVNCHDPRIDRPSYWITIPGSIDPPTGLITLN